MLCFNPRSHEGNDYKGFNKDMTCRGFNPRSHEGNDNLCGIAARF